MNPLDHWEKLERLSERFGIPHCPEFELEYFRTLYFPELDACDPSDLVARGRLKRVLGDAEGAARDFIAALDADPARVEAHAFLAELDLERPEAMHSLERAGDGPAARLYRGAALLLRNRPAEALRELEGGGTLSLILAGVALERLKDRPGAYARYVEAAKRQPVCSAAHLLASRAAPSARKEVLHFRQAYNVSPVLGFITLQIDQTTSVESLAYVRRIRKFCFEQPEKVGAYYKREATQSHFSHFPAEDYDFVKRLVARQPGIAWAQAFFGRAACYTQSGAPEGVARLTRAIELCPEAGWHYAWRANARRIVGQTREALADFAKSIELQPYYHRAFVWRGSLLRKLGRHAEALADLDRAAAMDPYYSLTYYERSMTRRVLGDMVGAALDLDRAFMLDHRYAWVFKTGGEPSQADLDAGLAQLDAAVTQEPGTVSLRAWRGALRLQRHEPAQALDDLEAATQLDPHHFLSWAWRGKALLQLGRLDEAAASVRRALQLEPRLWVAYGWLAEAEQARGRAAAARKVLDEVIAKKPTTPWAFRLRAQFALEAGKARAALPLLKHALLLDGKYPEAYLLLAQAKLALGDLRGALEAADKCVEIAPNLGRAYVVRAAVNQRAGRHRRVIEDYRTALTQFPYLFNEEERAKLKETLGA